MILLEIAVWTVLFLLAYGYGGYLALLWAVSLFVRNDPVTGGNEPSVTVLITAYNEEKHIRDKLRNTFTMSYPPEKLEVIVASDGSTDRTDEIVRRWEKRNVRLVRVEGRRGKTAAQNEAVRQARGEIVVFSDATTRYEKQALEKIVRNFNDPRVGCVTGRLRYSRGKGSGVGRGTASYWEYEVAIKKLQSRIWTLTGATGCIYAVRRPLYRELPPDIISDLVEPLAVLDQGYRIVFEPDAVAVEETCAGERDEMSMRVRVITRGMRGLLFMKALFNPVKHPYYFFQIVSHKVLRWFFFQMGAVLLLCTAALAPGNGFYAGLLLAQGVFYASALGAYVLQRSLKKEIKVVSLTLYFCLVNAASVLSLLEVVRGKKRVTWETNR